MDCCLSFWMAQISFPPTLKCLGSVQLSRGPFAEECLLSKESSKVGLSLLITLHQNLKVFQDPPLFCLKYQLGAGLRLPVVQLRG